MRTLVLLASLLAVTLTAATAASSASASTRSCATSDRFLGELRATNVSCPTARTVMNAWARTRACAPGADGTLAQRARTCTVRRFRCVPRRSTPLRVRCTRGRAVVRFIDSA